MFDADLGLGKDLLDKATVVSSLTKRSAFVVVCLATRSLFAHYFIPPSSAQAKSGFRKGVSW